MQSKEVSFYEWQRRFSSEKKCLNHLLRQHWPWPNGFVCPRCQFQRGYLIARRRAACMSVCRVGASGSHVGDGRHRVSFDKAAFEQVVLGSLLGVHGQGWYLGVAPPKASGGELAHRILEDVELFGATGLCPDAASGPPEARSVHRYYRPYPGRG